MTVSLNNIGVGAAAVLKMSDSTLSNYNNKKIDDDLSTPRHLGEEFCFFVVFF